MILYVNSKNEVKDVNITSDNSLTPLTVNDENNPFIGWSVAKICCYKVEVTDGVITIFTPYVDSKIIEHIDNLGKANEVNANDITNMQLAICDIYESTL